MRRLALLIWGTDFDPALRPLLAVGFFQTLAGSSAWPFLGIWALRHLGASQVQLSAAFLLGALAAVASGWLGGHLSDYVGRRPVMLAAVLGFAAVPIALIAVGHHVIAGLAAMTVFGVFASMFNAAQSAMVADVLPPERREAGYASLRVANNLGVCCGPPLGGLLLLGDAWTRLFLGVFALGVLALVISARLLPRRGVYAPESAPERSSFAVVRRDHPFLLFVFSQILAFMTYVYAGFVAFGQLRLTRAVMRFSPSLKLAVAMPLMGFPFLLLSVADSIVVVAVLMTIFVLGEMLWVPTSQTVVARFAPADVRGAYMGVYGSASQAAWALTPFAGLQVRHGFGDETMWGVVAAISLVAAAVAAVATTGRRVASAPR